MQFIPTPFHQWLKKLTGEWVSETECVMGPDQPPVHTRGSESASMLGEAWLISHLINGQSPTDESAKSTISLGYDPVKQKFVGTFVSAMMAHLWIYEGTLNDAQTVLTLNAKGPGFKGTGEVDYQDIIEIVNDDYRLLTSQCKLEDGTWVRFMTSHIRRVTS